MTYVTVTESIELFKEDQAFSRPIPFYPPLSSASCLSFSVFLSSCLTDGKGRGWGRSHIIGGRESLVLYKSFHTLCICTLSKTTNTWIGEDYSDDFCSESRIGNFQTHYSCLPATQLPWPSFLLSKKINSRGTLDKNRKQRYINCMYIKGRFVYVYESSGVLNYMLV